MMATEREELGFKLVSAASADRRIIAADTPAETVERICEIIDGEIATLQSSLDQARWAHDDGKSWSAIKANYGLSKAGYEAAGASLQALRILKRKLAAALVMPREASLPHPCW